MDEDIHAIPTDENQQDVSVAENMPEASNVSNDPQFELPKRFRNTLIIASIILLVLVVWQTLPTKPAKISVIAVPGRNSQLVKLCNPNFVTPVDVDVISYPRDTGSLPILKTYAHIPPLESKIIDIIPTGRFTYEALSNTSSDNKGSLSGLISILITLLPGIIPALTGLIIASYVVARMDKMKQEELRIKESTLLKKEFANIINHLQKNINTLQEVSKQKEIPATLIFDKMKIDESALILSVDTARVLKDDHKLDRFLTARLRLRNLNIELNHVIQYMKRKNHTWSVYSEFCVLIDTKLKHAQNGVIEAYVAIAGKWIQKDVGPVSKVVYENPNDVKYQGYEDS